MTDAATQGAAGSAGSNGNKGSKGSNGSATVPRGVANALDEELFRLEDLKARGWLVLGGLLAAAGVVTTLAIESTAAVPAFVAAASIGVWFTFMRRSIRRGHLPMWQRVVTEALEIVAPWIMFAGMSRGAGPGVAITAWGPLLLFGAIMLLRLLRLDPRGALLQSVFGAVLYLAIALLIVQPQLDPALLDEMGLEDKDLVVHAVGLALSGVLCGFVARGLRQAFGSSVRVARARELFGKYRLERELAAGGMGTVWLATYCPEGGFLRPAAVKRIHPHLAKDEAFVAAFRREAELGARLVHHNVVQVLDFGKIDDAYFLAMEYVDGCSCAELAKRAATLGISIPPRVVALIGRDVLSGLSYAHTEARDADGALLRVVHRDLAPQNVLVSKVGLVKITDFGIARSLRDSTSAVTKAVGHAGHVAPEHIDGKPIDERSDLFLVGVLLWELVCGRSLFVRAHEMATLHALLLEPAPRASTIDPSLRAWDAFLERALAKAPTDRYASAAEMLAALEHVIASDGVGVAAPAELAGLVKALDGKDIHDAHTVPLGGAVGTPSNDVTAAT